MLLFQSSPILAASPRGQVDTVSIDELKAMIDNGENIAIIDVRTRGDYQGNKIKIIGAYDMPLAELDAKARQLPFGARIITYCS